VRSTVARAVPGSSCRARHKAVQALRMQQTASASLHLAAHLVLAESPRSSQLARSCTRMAVCRSRNLRAGEGPWSGAGAGLASKKRLHAASGSCMRRRRRTRRGRARSCCCPPAQKVALLHQAGNAGAPGALGIVVRDACAAEQQGRGPLISNQSALHGGMCRSAPGRLWLGAPGNSNRRSAAMQEGCRQQLHRRPAWRTKSLHNRGAALCSARHRSWGWRAAPWQAHRSARRRFRRPSLASGLPGVTKHWCPQTAVSLPRDGTGAKHRLPAACVGTRVRFGRRTARGGCGRGRTGQSGG
jgi:hypothetical protein